MPRRLPEGLLQLIQKCLVWHPSARFSITEAIFHRFLQPPGEALLQVRFATQPGKLGVGTIAEGWIDPDLLRYLQLCPDLKRLAETYFHNLSKCVSTEEAALGFKSEFPGFVDEETPRSANPSTETGTCS